MPLLSIKGFGRLSMVAASAAQSAANVVQAGTKEISSKVFGSVYLFRMHVMRPPMAILYLMDVCLFWLFV